MGLQTTMSSILTRLFPRLAKVQIGGTITTNSNASLFPTAISNEILGGHHGLETVDDLANIPNDRLVVPMLATVKEHVVNNKTINRTTYVLDRLPISGDRLSDNVGYNISDYWSVFKAVGNNTGNLQIQYAPNIDELTGQVNISGNRPPFPGSNIGVVVTKAEYNNLTIGSNTDIASLGTQVPGYWSNTYDATSNHTWYRERYDNNDWGIPVLIGQTYDNGEYVDTIYKVASTQPSTPAKYVNGLINNNPTGWSNLPSTGRLWLSRATKDSYLQLKSDWSIPIEITITPTLVRYNVTNTPDPNVLVYDTTGSLSLPNNTSLTFNGWVETYNPRHQYQATRTLISAGNYSDWIVTKINGLNVPNPTQDLIDDINSSSFSNGNGFSGGSINLGVNGVWFGEWFKVTNSSLIDKHVVIKFAAHGYNSDNTTGGMLLGSLDYGSDGMSSDYFNLSTLIGPTWTDVVEFQSQVNGRAIGQNLSSVSIHRIKAGQTVYFRTKFNNIAGGTIVLTNMNYNYFLV